MNQIKTVDLFCGCGGMSLGFEQARFDIRAAYDNWNPALAVHEANLEHDTLKLDLSDVAAVVESVKDYEPRVVIGGPPCQDFSNAGYRDESRGRAALTTCYARVIEQARPDWFVMENVPAIKRSARFAEVCDMYHAAGYGLTCRVLDASYCGCPQARKRLFIIGGLGEDDGFLDKALDGGLADNPMTVRDYLGDALGVEYYFRVPTTYSRRGVFSIDEPAPTVRGVDRPVPKGYKGHRLDPVDVREVRTLTPRERSLIQTFPPDFKFFGTKTARNQMIGNAVPPELAAYVGRCLMGYIKGEVEYTVTDDAGGMAASGVVSVDDLNFEG